MTSRFRGAVGRVEVVEREVIALRATEPVVIDRPAKVTGLHVMETVANVDDRTPNSL